LKSQLTPKRTSQKPGLLDGLRVPRADMLGLTPKADVAGPDSCMSAIDLVVVGDPSAFDMCAEEQMFTSHLRSMGAKSRGLNGNGKPSR
jgi:hypothetical protein